MVNDYDCEILYHPGKANVVVDALSHMTMIVPIEDLCLRMIIVSPLLDMTRMLKSKSLGRKIRRSKGSWVRFHYFLEISVGY